MLPAPDSNPGNGPRRTGASSSTGCAPGRKLRPAEWPGGARCAVALSFDSDHETSDLRDGGKSIGRLAWGQYGNRVGVPRILDVLEEIRGQGELLRARGHRAASSRRAAPGRRRGSRDRHPRLDPRAELGAALRGRARPDAALRRHARKDQRRAAGRLAHAVLGFQPEHAGDRKGDGARSTIRR